MFIRAANPVWFFVDLNGLPLNDEYYISFLQNIFPYLPQAVYRDNQGITPWNNPIQFLPNGTLPDNLFFQSDLVYRLEIRHGNTQNDQLVYEINDFVPNGGNINPDSGSAGLENQVSNPQFAFINFVSPLSITTAGTHSIAPDWDLVLTGSGTATVTQLISTAAQDLPGTNIPPYALRFAISSGWTSAILQQRFNGLGGIFNNSFISMSVLARSEVGGGNDLILNYVPNPPGTPITIAQGQLTTGTGYSIIQGVQPLHPSTNTTQSNLAFIDMQIVLPVNGTTDISDVMVSEQSSLINTPFALLPDETLERQQDHLFHYYADQLINNPKNSILVGWNFSLNPFQFNPKVLTTAVAQTTYICDQTIIHQEAASRVITGQGADFQRFGLLVKAINLATDNRFALIQYIDPGSIRPYWGYVLSSLVQALMFSVTHSNVRIKMRLIYRTTLPPVISATEPIVSWAAYDINNPPDPVFAAGWTEIKPINDPAYTLPQSDAIAGTEYPAVAFNGFQLPTDAAETQTLGIVLYTVDPMKDTLTTEDSIVFDKVSLVPNDFAVQTHPQTFDQCLRECQFYYEKSYNLDALPGAVTLSGAQTVQLSSATGNIAGIDRPFKVAKRISPIVTWYSTAGATPARARNLTLGADVIVTANLNVGIGTTGYFTTSLPVPDANAVGAQWSADARLGL